MKIFDIEQGSIAWYAARAGIPTASEFSNIITPKNGSYSKSAEKYANRLVAEIYMREPIQKDFVSFDMERGKILEQMASDAYEMVVGEKTKIAGFITDDKGMYGCSPDRFVGETGLVEIKCLKPENHMELLLKQEMPYKYKPQIQGQLLICEDREFVDWWLYHPSLPAVQIRNVRDEVYIAKLKSGLERFWEIMLKKLDRLKALGYDWFELSEGTILDAG